MLNITVKPRKRIRVAARTTRLKLPPRAARELHDVTHDANASIYQGWCGPSALSAITGRTAETAAAWLNRERGTSGLVIGTEILEVSRALNRLGYALEAEYVTDGAYGSGAPSATVRSGPSLGLADWLSSRERSSDLYLADVTHDGEPHWIAVLGDSITDSLSPHGTSTSERGATSQTIVRRTWRVTLLENAQAAATRQRASDPLPLERTAA